MSHGSWVEEDADLAELYGVDTGTLNRAVKRNHERLPADFMFQLTDAEVAGLRCQSGTLPSAHAAKKTTRRPKPPSKPATPPLPL
jgi:hypothetical protein